jgi:hypothetical protein
VESLGSRGGTPITSQYHSLYKLGGVGLIAYGSLVLAGAFIDQATGPPPPTPADILAWVNTHERLVAFPSELLFFEAAFLVPGTAALYHSLAPNAKATTVVGCGMLAIAISVMALLAVVHGRLAYPVYGIRVRTPDVAAFAVSLYYGGLHAISLLLGSAIICLGLAMNRGVCGKRIAHFGFVTGPVAIVGGYPYAIGPTATLFCQAVVAAWFVAAGATLYRPHCKRGSAP